MAYLLNLAYLTLLAVASPWLVYRALAHGKYRDDWQAKWLGLVPRREGDRPCIWFHAVSVGEVNLLEPLITSLGHHDPAYEIVVSTTTRTGYTLAHTRYPNLSVFYCPLDFSWATRRAMRRIRPSLFVLAELELWPNLIAAARRQGARVAIVNARLSQRSFAGYRRIALLVRHLLSQIDLIAAQNDAYAARFRALGASPQQLHPTGSLKFDRAQTDRQNPATQCLRELAGLASGDRVFLAGSTQSPRRPGLGYLSQAVANVSRVMFDPVPRHPERFDALPACSIGAVCTTFAVPTSTTKPRRARLAFCWSTRLANWEPGGERPTWPSSGAASDRGADKT